MPSLRSLRITRTLIPYLHELFGVISATPNLEILALHGRFSSSNNAQPPHLPLPRLQELSAEINKLEYGDRWNDLRPLLMDSLRRLEVTSRWMFAKETNTLLWDLSLRCPHLEYLRLEEEIETKSLIDFVKRAAGTLQQIVILPVPPSVHRELAALIPNVTTVPKRRRR